VTTVEQARSIVELLDILNIEALDVVGASYGGMVALALAQEWPERVRRLVVISAAHESHPMATGLRALQRRVVELGLRTGSVTEAMAIARGIAMTTYRTSGEFAERFDLTPRDVDGALEFDVEQYLMHAGEKFAAHTAPERFLALSLSSDLHHVTPERIAAPTTVIASHGDTLVPAAQTTELARRLPHLAAHHTLHTRYGHDAFLLEVSSLGQLLIDALSD
jgi:homoserine O-acetyltransferase